MYKRIEFDPYFPKTGEATIQLAAFPNRRGGMSIEKRAFAQSESPLYGVLDTIRPEVGVTYLLVNALSAWEYYDDNKNGDGFNERPYRVGVRASCGHPDCTKTLDGWIAEHELVTKHYHTFEEHGGIYVHHKNQDKSKSRGKVVKSIWNPKMHRNELLLRYVNDRGVEIVDRVASGDFPAVSMGCVTAGTRITLSSGEGTPVEQVRVGDHVITHAGRAQAVTALHPRTYSGQLYTLRPEAGKPFEATEEHPFLVVESSNVRRKTNKGGYVWRQDVTLDPVWKLASELRVGKHYLLQPILTETETPGYVTKAFARLLGYYLAEGSTIYDLGGRVVGFELSCHQDDVLLREVKALWSDLELPTPRIYVREHSPVARTVRTYDREIALKLFQLCGAGVRAKRKFLDSSVLRWAPEYQRELLGAYANGDGHGTPKGSLTLSTASRKLADQILTMLPRFGVLGSCATLVHRSGGGFNHAKTTEYVVNIGTQWAQGLRDVCGKVRTYVLRARKESRKIYGDYIATPIRALTSRAYTGPVYNFEVAEDNTYVTEGVVSHNCHVKWDVCTICGHRAATRAQYCDHARNHLRKILGDGRKVSVLNPSPKLFDISMVIKPADPTGWTLMKVAEDLAYAVSSAELGEQWQQAQRVSETFHKVAEEIGSAWANPTSFIGHFARQAHSAGVEPFPAQGTIYRFAAEKLGLDLSEQHIDRLVLATPALTAILGTYPEEIQKVASEIHHVMRQQAYEPSADFPDFGIGPGAAYRAAEPPRTDMLTVTDPYTGHVYQTTRGTAMDASRADVKDRLLRTGLFGGLYAAGLHLGLKGGLGLWSVPAGLALGASTDRFLRRSSPPYRNPLYQTDQGIPVSGGTEFKQASAWAAKLAEDLHERSGDGRIESILRRTSFTFQKWASLPVSEQVDYLLSNEGSAPLNASTLADNLYRLLTS